MNRPFQMKFGPITVHSKSNTLEAPTCCDKQYEGRDTEVVGSVQAPIDKMNSYIEQYTLLKRFSFVAADQFNILTKQYALTVYDEIAKDPILKKRLRPESIANILLSIISGGHSYLFDMRVCLFLTNESAINIAKSCAEEAVYGILRYRWDCGLNFNESIEMDKHPNPELICAILGALGEPMAHLITGLILFAKRLSEEEYPHIDGAKNTLNLDKNSSFNLMVEKTSNSIKTIGRLNTYY